MVCQFWKISDQAIEIVDLRIQVVVPAKNKTNKLEMNFKPNKRESVCLREKRGREGKQG